MSDKKGIFDKGSFWVKVHYCYRFPHDPKGKIKLHDYIEFEMRRYADLKVREFAEKIMPTPERNPYKAIQDQYESEMCLWWNAIAEEIENSIKEELKNYEK